MKYIGPLLIKKIHDSNQLDHMQMKIIIPAYTVIPVKCLIMVPIM